VHNHGQAVKLIYIEQSVIYAVIYTSFVIYGDTFVIKVLKKPLKAKHSFVRKMQ